MAEEKSLAGWPTKALVRKVKSVLWQYVRCRPQITDPLWQKTWDWAAAVERRESLYKFGKAATRKHWPAPNEIATQYLILAITEMKSFCALRLPFHAATQMPDSVKLILKDSKLVELSLADPPRLPAPVTHE